MALTQTAPLPSSVEVIGDGVSTTITVDLLKPPLNTPWASNLPVEVIDFASQGLANATLVGSKLTLVFASPIPNGGIASLSLRFRF